MVGRPGATEVGQSGAKRASTAPSALPAALVLGGAVSVQTGAGIASRLFSQLPPASVTALRLWSAAHLGGSVTYATLPAWLRAVSTA